MWVCSDNDKHIFDEADNGWCHEKDCEGNPCKGILVWKEEGDKKEGGEEAFSEGENGLGILILDLSGSMKEKAFSGENPQTKIELVARALGAALPETKKISKADKAYIAIIGFSTNAELIGIYQVSQLNDDSNYWVKFVEDKHKEKGDSTNIIAALKLAYELYSAALDGTFGKKYGIKDFSIGCHAIPLKDTFEVKRVPNIRIFIYSDGGYSSDMLKNPFANESLIPGVKGINGIISVYFGPDNSLGSDTMKDIAGTCPVHGVKGFILVGDPKMYNLLRSLFHMTGTHSGFCPSCIHIIYL